MGYSSKEAIEYFQSNRLTSIGEKRFVRLNNTFFVTTNVTVYCSYAGSLWAIGICVSLAINSRRNIPNSAKIFHRQVHPFIMTPCTVKK